MSGEWLLFGVYQREAKKDMKLFLKDNHNQLNLVQLKVTLQNTADFVMDDDENEVEFDKKLYDVVYKEQINDTTILNCTEDENETNLVEAYNKYIESQHKESSGSKSAFQGLFASQVYDQPQSFILEGRQIQQAVCPQLAFEIFKIYNISSKVVTPPPQI